MGNQEKVFAIISDYDGTLCPAKDIRDNNRNRIPKELESLLSEISKHIPVCILSSKDYGFLHDKVPFSNIISCIMGLETLVVDRDKTSRVVDIKNRHLMLDEDRLRIGDNALNQLADDVAARFPQVAVERKFTSEGLLGGITFDWRHLRDWKEHSRSVGKYVKEMLSKEPYCFSPRLFLKKYSSHPFVDVYASKCNKGVGLDCIAVELGFHKTMGKILYLGDSENDNPAFIKADISVGVLSDYRLNPDLRCKYMVDYSQLYDFLNHLKNDDFIFSKQLAASIKSNLH